MAASTQIKARLLLKLLCFNFFVFLHAHESRSAYYKQYPGYRIQTCLESYAGVPVINKCALLCSEKQACVGGSYLKSTGQCCLTDHRSYEQGPNLAQDSNAVYFEDNKGWRMVYRAVASNGQGVYGSFLDTGTYTESPFECWTTSTSRPSLCNDHRRSKLLEFWDQGIIDPQQVKFTLYKNETEQAYIVFDGAGSNLTTWFTPSRILSSSYTDINKETEYTVFSVYGLVDTRTTRPFYVSGLLDGCDNDWGWITVVERQFCSWESLGAVPLLLFSPSTGVNHWDVNGVGTGKADILAIFVQL